MSNRTILIVDDEAHVTHILARKLELAGITTLVATDGQEGYDLAVRHKPDCIITDFQMPILSGYDMCVKLYQNAETSRIPVLMLTARGHKLSPTDLTRTNIREMMGKPFSAREILAKALALVAMPEDGPAGTVNIQHGVRAA